MPESAHATLERPLMEQSTASPKTDCRSVVALTRQSLEPRKIPWEPSNTSNNENSLPGDKKEIGICSKRGSSSLKDTHEVNAKTDKTSQADSH
jgi:hypothetical protein